MAFIALLCFGCEHHGDDHASIQEINVEEIPKEIQIPTKLWDFIEGKADPNALVAAHGDEHGAHGKGHGDENGSNEGHGGGGEHGGGGGHGGAAAGADGVDVGSGGALFAPIDVILTEKNSGVLTQSPLKIRLPRGGGTIDLATYVTQKQGSFFVRFEWPELEDPKALQSWFVSKARKRRLGDELWGSGCSTFMRITQGLEKIQKGDGLKVNTTRLRHLTVLGGHFVFSSRKSGQTSISQVTFKDSRYPELFCEAL